MPTPELKRKIAVDIDEVLFPMVEDLVIYVEQEHGVKLTPEQFEAYSLEAIWPKGSDEGAIVFENYKNQITTEIAPVKGAAAALGKLAAQFEIIIMTARDAQMEDATRRWLDRHFPEVFNEAHLLGNEEESGEWRAKADVCGELGIYCLIDDSLRHVREASAAGIDCLLFGDYPWNQADDLSENVTRVKDWPQALEYFDAKS